jgi:hypothetical protein
MYVATHAVHSIRQARNTLAFAALTCFLKRQMNLSHLVEPCTRSFCSSPTTGMPARGPTLIDLGLASR